jgi:small subunit ribosomal protein S20
LPNHKSCAKRMRSSAGERTRNRAFRSQLRQAIKDVRSQTSKVEALKKLQAATAILDKAAAAHIIHQRNADRNKSRLALFVGKLG